MKIDIETYAAIDIGANAIRMLVSNVDKKQKYPDFKKVTFIRVPIRSGEDVFTHGKVSREKKNYFWKPWKDSPISLKPTR